MHKVNRALTAIENGIAGFSLIAAVGIAVISIVLRAGFETIIFWSEEAIIYLIITSTFFGAIITLRDNGHVNAIAVLGWLLLTEPFSFDTVTPALKLPLGAVETAVPVAFTLMFIRAIAMLWSTWKHGVQELTAAEVAQLEAEAAGVSAEDIENARRESLATLERQHLRAGGDGSPPGQQDGQAQRGTDGEGGDAR